jgi:transcriptional regulator with XRE-family HTH domain
VPRGAGASRGSGGVILWGAGLGISARELSEAANVAESTILRFESGKGGLQMATLARLQAKFEADGVEFIGDDGVRVHPKK